MTPDAFPAWETRPEERITPLYIAARHPGTPPNHDEAESVGIHSWNTERSDFVGRSATEQWRDDITKPLRDLANGTLNHFYLPKENSSNFDEPSLFEASSMNGMHRTRSYSPRKERRNHDDKTSR
ncbi:unnamed protein product [Angiostrongylus costaricensis]|uniref:Uncharacterized protein n=1 Tax=Angiostrongylus costaricensis TaxID=334426 RepID=A0A0R3PKE6_ANGCS|nr:unnamed protein product [Angiostrongylus costaricensis]